MTTEWRFLFFSAVFSVVVAVIYWIVAAEEAGTTLLALMGGAAGLMGAYLFKKGRRLRRAEDDPEADHDEAGGDVVGFFSAGSLWPFVMALGATITVIGLVYGVWVLVPGMAIFAWAVIGLMTESRG